MHWVDIVVLSIVGISVVIGLFRGLVKESVSLASWILGVWLALTLSPTVAGFLPFEMSSLTLKTAVAGIIVFIVVLIAGGIVNYLAGQLVDKTGLSGTDRLLGMVFGFGRGAILVAMLVLLAHLTSMPTEPWWQESAFLPFFTDVATWVKGYLPDSIASRLT